MGTGSAGAGALTEFLRVLFVESPEAAPPFHFPNTVANAPASQVSIELKLFGPNVTITQKDPSALNALLYATLALSSGARAGDARGSRRRVERDLRARIRPRRRSPRREAPLRDRPGRGGVRRAPRGQRRARGSAERSRSRASRASRGRAFLPSPTSSLRTPPRSSGRSARRSPTPAPGPATIGLWFPSRNGVLEMDRAEARRDALGLRTGAARDFRQGRDRRDGGLRRRTDRRRVPRDRRTPQGRSQTTAVRGARSSTPSARAATSWPRSSSPCPRRTRRHEPRRAAGAARFADSRSRSRCASRSATPTRVVWHGHYALYLEQVREAFTGRFGFTATTALSIGYRVPITRMEIRYRQAGRRGHGDPRYARGCGPRRSRSSSLDYEIRDAGGELLASAETEQVVLNAQGELLLTLAGGPADAGRRACSRSRTRRGRDPQDEPATPPRRRRRAAGRFSSSLRFVVLLGVFAFLVACEARQRRT